MAEFYISLAKSEIAEQIANMLNNFNKLTVLHDEYTINNSNTCYFIKTAISSVKADIVIGCVGLYQDSHNTSKIKHLCVIPQYRRFGIAKNLIKVAILNCKTDYVYMTIREDNIPSLMLAKSLGFVFVKKSCNILTVARRK